MRCQTIRPSITWGMGMRWSLPYKSFQTLSVLMEFFFLVFFEDRCLSLFVEKSSSFPMAFCLQFQSSAVVGRDMAWAIACLESLPLPKYSGTQSGSELPWPPPSATHAGWRLPCGTWSGVRGRCEAVVRVECRIATRRLGGLGLLGQPGVDTGVFVAL